MGGLIGRANRVAHKPKRAGRAAAKLLALGANSRRATKMSAVGIVHRHSSNGPLPLTGVLGAADQQGAALQFGGRRSVGC